jgi:hypothetical protein
MYSVNIEPHTAGPPGSVTEFAIDIDEHYVAECRERALVLAAEPLRFQALPHMMSAQWDCLELIMESLARDYPQHFSLARAGNRWHWINRPLGIDRHFTFGEASSLPPAARLHHPPGAGRLGGDGSARGRSVDRGRHGDHAGRLVARLRCRHDLQGMARTRALAHELGVFDRALKFLLNLRLGAPVRRLNWTMTVHPRLDTSPENYPFWGPDRAAVTALNAGDLVHLRVELQGLWRLPRSNAVVFSIRCYLISLRELVTVPEMGAPRAPRAQEPAPRAGRLQGPRALPRCRGRVAGALR